MVNNVAMGSHKLNRNNILSSLPSAVSVWDQLPINGQHHSNKSHLGCTLRCPLNSAKHKSHWDRPCPRGVADRQTRTSVNRPVQAGQTQKAAPGTASHQRVPFGPCLWSTAIICICLITVVISL